MTIAQNILNGQLYGLYWAMYSNRPEMVAVPQSNVFKTIRNPDRMDFVTISPEAVKAVKETSSTRMDP